MRSVEASATQAPALPMYDTPGKLSLRAHEYAHVEDTRRCEVLTLLGPLIFPLEHHHKPLHPRPQCCVVVRPDCYVAVMNPVHRRGTEAAIDGSGYGAGYPLLCAADTAPHLLRHPTTVEVRVGEREVRFSQEPFPLFPGEELDGAPARLTLLRPDEAIPLTCTRAFTYAPGEDNGRTWPPAAPTGRRVGERYYKTGPGLYYPRGEEKRGAVVRLTSLTLSQAAYLCAREAFTEQDGTQRYAGEEWTVRMTGLYLPPPYARVTHIATAIPLPAGTAAHVRARGDMVDAYTGVRRRAGEEWYVTCDTVPAAYVPGHLEEVLSCTVRHVVLRHGQYCVVENPAAPSGAAAGVRWGARELRVGPQSFFLARGERLVGVGVREVYTLATDEALLVTAEEAFTDADGCARAVAARWLITGPRRYIPELAVRVEERRHVIALHQNEGVYVRNTRTGTISAVHGRPFMLSEDEELWEKPVSRYVRRLMAAPRLCIRSQEEPDIIEDWKQSAQSNAEAMLASHFTMLDVPWSSPSTSAQAIDSGGLPPPTADGAMAVDANGVRQQPRDIRRYAVVSVNVEQNTLVRLQDTNTGSSRVVAGPAAVSLAPYEEFTCVSLSGGRPKQPHRIHTLSLFLGPDYMSDTVEVETLDHARLKLDLAYNWDFDVSDMDGALRRVFTIPDFIGEACKTLASRVRTALASVIFEDFHRNSSAVIRQAIFSAGDDGSTEVHADALCFSSSGLRITNVDLQSVEPVDPKTRTALAKSVQLAVEIITKSQENKATQHASRIEQEARGALDLQTVTDRAAAERERDHLLEVVVHNVAIEQCSAARVQALAESEALLVEAKAELDAAPTRCAAHEVGVDAELEVLQRRMDADLAHRRAINDLQVERARQLAHIEASRYEAIMAALGQDTLVAIAQAGPELKARMLGALGLQGFLVTDGSSPINLVNVAKAMTAPAAAPHDARGAG